MLGLRLNHPAAQDNLELLPGQAATRAEAAWSFAQTLTIQSSDVAEVQQAADALTVPTLTPWQQKILTTAVHYVGYPYVWGGTSPTAEVDFGVPAVGGFDCSGFVWRVYKLTSYPGEGSLAGTLRGRTTYVMSGEVPRSERITEANLQPADVLFFGDKGPKSSPNDIDHTGIYLGDGWFDPVVGRGRDRAPVRWLVCREFRLGPPAAARSRLGVVAYRGQPPSCPIGLRGCLPPASRRTSPASRSVSTIATVRACTNCGIGSSTTTAGPRAS